MKVKSEIKRFIKGNKILIVSLGILFIVLGFFAYQGGNPHSLNGMLKKGEKLEREGKMAAALNIYNELVREYPQNYDTHYQLGKLLQQVQEPEKAKVEYFRAINIGVASRHEAQVAMAQIYQHEKNYSFAEQLLKSLARGNKSKPVKEALGKFYLDWGKELVYSDKLESLNKYKLAYRYLLESDSRELITAKKALEKSYSSIATILIEGQREESAIKLLESSLKLFDNAEAHYKLGEIYEYHDIDKSIDEYRKAFKLNSNIGNKSYFANLLTSHSNSLREKGNYSEAEELKKEALKFAKNTAATISLPDQNVIVNLASTRTHEDLPKNTLIPGISFKVRNISKEEIKYLKAKVIFWSDNSIHDQVVQTLTSSTFSLKPDEATKELNIYSSKPIKDIFFDHNIKIQILISQTQPDSWKLYRNTYIPTRKR